MSSVVKTGHDGSLQDPVGPSGGSPGSSTSTGEAVARYARQEAGDPKPAISTPGVSPGRGSHCGQFLEAIVGMLDQGLPAQRACQDLVAEDGFERSYQSIKRFCRHQRWTSPVPFRRVESEPGQELQVDFGKGARVVGADGRKFLHRRRAGTVLIRRRETFCLNSDCENLSRLPPRCPTPLGTTARSAGGMGTTDGWTRRLET